uniref:Uncharacterized protein n=1 Tax=Arundo donax TaxID=35708 RepID=A0A0A9AA93_ARUDO
MGKHCRDAQNKGVVVVEMPKQMNLASILCSRVLSEDELVYLTFGQVRNFSNTIEAVCLIIEVSMD